MYKAIAANKRNTVFIMIVFIMIIAALGYIFSQVYGSTGIFWGTLVGASIYAFMQYFLAAKIALGVNGAKEIAKRDNPRLYRIVENLAITNGMPMPKVYVIDDPAPNAFATGRDPKHAHVAATSGILEIMDDRELEAVMAHELGHVKNLDIRVMMIVFGLVSAIGLIADLFLRMMWFSSDDNRSSSPIFMILGIVAALITPFIAMLVQLAVSRQREYLADATGAMTTRDPEGLATALEKIGQYGSGLRRQNSSTAHLFFANPLKGASIAKLFSTHPPVEERVARLRAMGNKF
ncbi:TPA: protease [Candidatus Saccharibacteria bacterium]|nr:protease [Candidatus Saccharibacteria bacterium]HRJ90972.1 M48 family metallopeptidase [Candidatus Saccharibacteria bacterium]